MIKAKKYLSQSALLDMKINLKLKELQGLRTKLTGVGCVNYSNDKVQKSTPNNAQFSETLHNIECLENEINTDIDELVKEKHDIAKQIYYMHNKDDIAVLFKRYIECKSFEQIASEMVYSVRYIYYIHNRALDAFEKMCL